MGKGSILRRHKYNFQLGANQQIFFGNKKKILKNLSQFFHFLVPCETYDFQDKSEKRSHRNFYDGFIAWAGGQNFERRNVESSVYRNFEIANIKIKKDELFDNFIFELFFFYKIIWTPKIFHDFWYYKILIFQMVKLKKIS